MHKRRRMFMILCPLALALAALFLWSSGSNPCRAKFELVEKGMTKTQIEEIVGGPPGVYSNRLELPTRTGGPPSVQHFKWVASDGTLEVIYDAERESAVSVRILEPPPDPRGPFERAWDQFRYR